MNTKKGHFLRFSLTHAECGYDHVQVYAIYSGVKDHPRGNARWNTGCGLRITDL